MEPWGQKGGILAKPLIEGFGPKTQNSGEVFHRKEFFGKDYAIIKHVQHPF